MPFCRHCAYKPSVADATLAASLLQIHAMSAHQSVNRPDPGQNVGARVEKVKCPVNAEGGTEEEWLYFEQRWNEYKAATRITGHDLIYQLLDCCDEELRKNRVKAYQSIVGCDEITVLKNIKSLAVRSENAMVAGDLLSRMRQDRDEPVRAYAARLKG